MKKRITLTTYYEGLHKRKQSMMFSVPVEWLLTKIWGMDLNEFLDTYTWDDSLEIKRLAKKENVFKYD